MPEIVEFRPFDRQRDFSSLPDSIFEALYGGAAYGGKTQLLMMLPIMREWYKHPKFKGILFRRTFPELEREVIRRSEFIFPLTGAKYDKERHSWKWPCGSYFDFAHCEHESDIKKYDTSEYNYVAFDELTTFTEFQYLYMTSRCRSATPELSAIVRSGSNPDGEGHSWVKKRFVSDAPKGYTIIKDLSGNKRIFIPALATDNPYLKVNDPDYINRLNLLPEPYRSAKLYGSWDINIGSAFNEFRRMHYDEEPLNAIHICKPFNIPKEWPGILAMDWGWSARNSIGKFRLSPDGRIYVETCYSSAKEYIANLGIKIIKMMDCCKYLFLDPSAWQKDPGKPKSIAQQLQEASGVSPIKATNDRVAGKQLIHEYLRWNPKDIIVQDPKNFDQELANKILRIGGLESYHKYMNSFKVTAQESNLPKLQIFDTKENEELIEVFSKCMLDDNNIEDVAEFNGDDPYDMLRYGLFGVQYLKNSINPLEIQRNKLSQDFTEGKVEINSYYRRMEYLDRIESQKVNGIRV